MSNMATIPTPRTQGLSSATFTQPPLDGSLSIPALYEWQAIHSAHHPLFIFGEVPGSQRTILRNEAQQGIERAAKRIREEVGYNVKSHSEEDPPVIAVLASADTISYMTFIVGALTAGCILFPLSLRNSPPATAALLQQTGASHLYVSSDKHVQELVEAATKQFAPGFSIKTHSIPVFEELFPTRGFDPTFVTEPVCDVDMNKTAVIFHSSGTTAFPKPIYITHRALILNSSSYCFGEADLAGGVLACHSVPMYHGLGILLTVVNVSTGLIFRVFKPQFPPVVPNPVNTLEGAVVSDYVLVTPTFVETWSQDSQSVKALAKIKGVIFAGGPLSKEAGDVLASNGVNIYQSFGSTQTFRLNSFLQKPLGMDWEYFEISPSREAHFIDYGDNEYELVVLSNEWYRPNVVNTQINGRDAYATSDLVSPHPTKPGLWRLVGRTDDQIMHSTGEKTNPGPLEGMLMRDPFVSGAVIFGRGRFHCGVLVEPKEPYKFDPSNTTKLSEFRSIIWPSIEVMNAFAPQHSRIFKEMIVVATQSKPFTYTAKGTLRRQAIIDEYEAEINATYAAVEESAQGDIEAPSDWHLPRTKDFVRKVVEKTMKKDGRIILDDTDLFERGLDSLQATWIRNSVLHALKQSHSAVARQIPLTFVYDNPTIARLSEFVSASVKNGSASPGQDSEAKRKELYALVDKYSANFPAFNGHQDKEGTGNVILLTGGTGSLGSNILAKLLESPDVTYVYAMSRPSSGQSAKERHAKTFEREGLDATLLEGKNVHFLDGDAERPDFGIDPALYQEMQTSVTHVIHSAWRVNFNVSVASFESNIRSIRNFVDFALGGTMQKPARISFISSVGVFQNYSEARLAPEEHLEQPDSAIGSGYAESKWVSEQILKRAMENTPLSATIVRCGQMTGGPSGTWNVHEWFPSLIKSSVALGMLPDTEGDISWITGYDAAGAIVDVLDTHSDILHLVHPKPATLSSIIKAFSEELRLPAVSLSEWVKSLEEAHANTQGEPSDAETVDRNLRENPALRLIGFFRAARQRSNGPFRGPFGAAEIDCRKAVEASETLRRAASINAETVGRWVSYWKGAGFL